MARTGRPKGTNNKEVNYTLRLDDDIEIITSRIVSWIGELQD